MAEYEFAVTEPLEFRRYKVTIEDGSGLVRVFAAAGDTVRYDRNQHVEARPPARPTQRWPKRVTTTHTLTWETVTYE